MTVNTSNSTGARDIKTCAVQDGFVQRKESLEIGRPSFVGPSVDVGNARLFANGGVPFHGIRKRE
jgi:hypothetical protein